MKYHLFIDESGDHGLTTVNPDFPVFVLCGILISETGYQQIRTDINLLKNTFWGNKIVIFHSRDIRKCEKEFQILLELEIKSEFYSSLNKILAVGDYKIIASAIKKDDYIYTYGRLADDVYEIALSFIIERAIFCLDAINDQNKVLEITIEKRGKAEDKKLENHFQRLLARGTGFVTSDRLKEYDLSILFKNKKENINGLQLADLVAYPIARYIIDPNRANPSFDLINKHFYSKDNKRFGLKVFPG